MHIVSQVSPMDNSDPGGIPQLNAIDRANLLQWAESERATDLMHSIAVFGYGRGSADHLTPEKAQTCMRLAALALRGTKPEWIQAALLHATEECKEAIGHELRTRPDYDRDAVAEIVAVKVVQAYLGILDGSIVLPPDVYLSISRDKVL